MIPLYPYHRCRVVAGLLLVAAVGGVSSAPGQTAAERDVIQLSPFSVDASQDSGYRASSTMAGSRMNTSLKDVASSIDVMTAEYLSDIAAVNLDEANLYSASTESIREVNDPTTNNGDLNRGVLNQFFTSRVRGLSYADRSRDFFRTNHQLDAYNTERFTASNGPNAILFGVGQPGGVVDTSLKRAHLGMEKNEIGLRFDSEGSSRSTFDVGRTLVENKLALRVAGLAENEKTFKQPNFDKKSRLYGALTYQPFKKTQIRGYYETITRDTMQPRNGVVRDYFTPYLQLPASQQVGVDWTVDGVQFNAGQNRWQAVIPSEYWGANGTLGGDDDIVRSNNNTRPVFILGSVANAVPALWSNPAVRWDRTVHLRAPHEMRPRGLFDRDARSLKDPDSPLGEIVDSGLFPWDVNFTGYGTQNKIRGDMFTLMLDQQIGDKFFLSLGYNKEDYRSWVTDYVGNNNAQVRIDINHSLPDGSPNPNYGLFYVESQPRANTWNRLREDIRLQASYELDLGKQSKWLGRHRFGTMFSKEHEKEEFQFYQMRIVNNPAGMNPAAYESAGGKWANHSDRQIILRHYLGAPGGGQGSYHVELPSAPFDDMVLPIGVNGEAVHLSTFNNPWGSTGNVFNDKKTIDGRMFSTQSYFFDDRLVLTYGKRTDKVKAAKIIPAENALGYRIPLGNTPFHDKEIPGGTRNANTVEGVTSINYPDYVWQNFGFSTSTETRGAVLHLTDKLRVFYNESNTFGVDRVELDAFGNVITGTQGNGQDMGVGFDLFEGKLSMKFNFFESDARNDRHPSDSGRHSEFARIDYTMMYELSTATNGAFANLPSLGYDPLGQGYFVTIDYESKGMEFSMTYNPTANWRISLNGSRMKAKDSDIALSWREYYAQRKDDWESVIYGASGQTGSTGNALLWGDVLRAKNRPDDGTNETLRQQYENDILPAIATWESFDGQARSQLPEYRFNLVTNYAFNQGRLNGFSVGGAVRWRDAAPVGFGSKIVDGREFLDLESPYMKKATTTFDAFISYRTKIFSDKVGLRTQLNVRNVFNNSGPVPQMISSTGEVTQFTLIEPRLFILSSTFEF